MGALYSKPDVKGALFSKRRLKTLKISASQGGSQAPFGEQSYCIKNGTGRFKGIPDGPLWTEFCIKCRQLNAATVLNSQPVTLPDQVPF